MNPAALRDRLAALQATLPRQIGQALAASALVAEAEAKQNATTLLKVHSGRLRNSIRTEIVDTGEAHEMALRAGNERDVVYARIQELGPRQVRSLDGVVEDVTFSLPKNLTHPS